MAWQRDTDLVPGMVVTISTIPEGSGYRAQCLEFDVWGSGATPDEAVAQLRAVASQVCVRDLPFAPGKYWWPEVSK